jgi:hypothetical protein
VNKSLIFASLLVVAGVAALAAQTPVASEAIDGRGQAAPLALDRYMETWNSRDPARWAASLHYPHIRPGPGPFELAQTAQQYAAGVDFNRTVATGWHHSEWTSRRVLQIGVDKVHIAGSWTRHTAEGRELTGSVITYIVTNQGGRWGVLSRFAAGASGLAAEAAAANTAAAQRAVDLYLKAWNTHDPQALASSLHYPHVRIGDGVVDVWSSPDEFLAGPEPGRQRTWHETRFDRVEVAQVSENGVNVAVTCSRRNRSGQVLSQYDAVILAVRRNDVWKIQAVSTMGT